MMFFSASSLFSDIKVIMRPDVFLPRRPRVPVGLHHPGPTGDGYLCCRASALSAVGRWWKTSRIHRPHLSFVLCPAHRRQPVERLLPPRASGGTQPGQVRIHLSLFLSMWYFSIDVVVLNIILTPPTLRSARSDLQVKSIPPTPESELVFPCSINCSNNHKCTPVTVSAYNSYSLL